jgi:hypothetical protein
MEYIWTTREGKKINVDDMDINHLRNALKMLMRVRVAEKSQRLEKVKRIQMQGEIAQEHADAYEVYKATGIDILNNEHLDGI